MALRAGFRRPTAVGRSGKPTPRGVKSRALVDYEAGATVDFNAHDGSLASEGGRAAGARVGKLLGGLRGEGRVISMDSLYSSDLLAPSEQAP